MSVCGPALQLRRRNWLQSHHGCHTDVWHGCRQLSHARRKARASAAPGAPPSAWLEKAAAAEDSLVLAFTTAPQTVLGICAQMLQKGRETDSSQGAKLFLSDTLAMPSRPGVPQSSSVAADVLTSRPEVREWMLSTVDTLKRGKPPSLPSLIAEQQILRDSMNSTGGSMHNLLLIYHRWQTREGASCIAELLGGHFEDLGPAARRQSVEPWPSCIGAPTRALDHRLSCEAAHPTAGAPPSNSWHCCDGG